MGELKEVLKLRDDLTPSEVDERIKEMVERVNEGDDPEEVLMDEGLEPDYVMDLLDYCSVYLKENNSDERAEI